jgi:hypothetical protein
VPAFPSRRPTSNTSSGKHSRKGAAQNTTALIDQQALAFERTRLAVVAHDAAYLMSELLLLMIPVMGMPPHAVAP